jgi:hypothetical protein
VSNRSVFIIGNTILSYIIEYLEVNEILCFNHVQSFSSIKAMLDLANSIKALKAFKGLLSFPDPLFDITVGLMLGDLSAVKRYPNSMAVLKFCQSYKHLDYLIHLYDLFSLYVSSSPRVYEINRSSGSYLQVSFKRLPRSP